MKTISIKIRLAFLCLLFCCAVTAQNIVQLSFYSPLISTADMKYINNHLVVAQDGLLTFDVSNPAVKPKLLSQVEYPGDYAYSNAVQNNQVYMAHGNNGIFAVYNISNFSSPALSGSLAIPATSFYVYGDMEPYGNYVYLSGFDSIYVINVSNSTAPVLANAFEVSHTDFSGAESVTITNKTLFVKAAFGVQVFGLADPVNPTLLTTVPYAPGHPYVKELAVDTINNRLFIPWLTALQQYEGFDAYDVSNPAAPKFLFSDSTSFGGGDFGISGYSPTNNVLYLSHGGGINVFDVGAAHGFVTSFTGEDIPNSSVSIQVRDSVFFNARGGGLEVLEYTDVVPPVCGTPSRLRSFATGTTIFLNWNKVPEAKRYIVRYRQVNHGWNYISSRDNVARITGLLPNTLYYWEVATVCDVSERFRSDFSLTERVVTGSALQNAPVIAAPNPVKNMFRVQINNQSVKQLVITNFAGSNVMQILNVANGQQVSCSQMLPGTYLLLALDNKGKILGKSLLIKE